MNIEPAFLLEVLIALGSGAGCYAAVRADLARLHERAQTALSAAEKAHRRIDAMLSK